MIALTATTLSDNEPPVSFSTELVALSTEQHVSDGTMSTNKILPRSTTPKTSVSLKTETVSGVVTLRDDDTLSSQKQQQSPDGVVSSSPPSSSSTRDDGTPSSLKRQSRNDIGSASSSSSSSTKLATEMVIIYYELHI